MWLDLSRSTIAKGWISRIDRRHRTMNHDNHPEGRGTTDVTQRWLFQIDESACWSRCWVEGTIVIVPTCFRQDQIEHENSRIIKYFVCPRITLSCSRIHPRNLCSLVFSTLLALLRSVVSCHTPFCLQKTKLRCRKQSLWSVQCLKLLKDMNGPFQLNFDGAEPKTESEIESSEGNKKRNSICFSSTEQFCQIWMNFSRWPMSPVSKSVTTLNTTNASNMRKSDTRVAISAYCDGISLDIKLLNSTHIILRDYEMADRSIFKEKLIPIEKSWWR